MKSLIDSPNFGILVFRVFIGLTMAFAHGLGKLPPPQMLIDGVQSMGFPLPIVFAWAAALSEFVGALLIERVYLLVMQLDFWHLQWVWLHLSFTHKTLLTKKKWLYYI